MSFLNRLRGVGRTGLLSDQTGICNFNILKYISTLYLDFGTQHIQLL